MECKFIEKVRSCFYSEERIFTWFYKGMMRKKTAVFSFMQTRQTLQSWFPASSYLRYKLQRPTDPSGDSCRTLNSHSRRWVSSRKHTRMTWWSWGVKGGPGLIDCWLLLGFYWKRCTPCIMTEDDYTALQDYRREKSEGTLTSHESLKKELGLWCLLYATPPEQRDFSRKPVQSSP